MSIDFRDAKREDVWLMIGIAAPSSGGKTLSALKVATGIADGHPFVMVDTENGRGKHYANRFTFQHGDLRAPFTPAAYADAITKAARHLESLGVPKYKRVVVVDSMSHEHAGEGGILDMQEAELQRMAGDDYRKREAVNQASWIKPKREHKRLMNKMLAIDAHIILCMRAEEKQELVKGPDGKSKMVPKKTLSGYTGWIPIAEKNVPFELTVSFLLLPDAPGVPHPIKLEEDHKPLISLDRPLSEETGRALAAWAAGGSTRETVTVKPANQSTGTITSEQRRQLADLVAELNLDVATTREIIKQFAGAPDSRLIPSDKYAAVCDAISIAARDGVA